MSEKNQTASPPTADPAVASSALLEHPASSRELEILQVKIAITETDAKIWRVEAVLRQMRLKQINRHREVASQEAYARCSNELAQRSALKNL